MLEVWVSGPSEIRQAEMHMPAAMKGKVKVCLMHNSLPKDGCIVTCAKGFRRLHALGARLTEDVSTSYMKVIGASIVLNGKIYLAAPELESMRYSRVWRVVYHRLLERWTRRDTFIYEPMDHSILKESDLPLLLDTVLSTNPAFMAVDLETHKLTQFGGEYGPMYGATIALAGMSLVYLNGAEVSIKTYTTTINSFEANRLFKAIMDTEVPKVFHNGGYDVQYLIRWDMPPRNYLWDTQYGMQSACPTLKIKMAAAKGEEAKSGRGFYSLFKTAAFFLLDNPYWKDGLHSTSFYEFNRYCAIDCHTTAQVAIMQFRMMSLETLNNFTMRFGALPSTTMASMTGMQIDRKVRKQLYDKYSEKLRYGTEYCVKMFGCKPSQSAELQKVLVILQDYAKEHLKPEYPQLIESADGDAIEDVSRYHPVLKKMLEPIKEARTAITWIPTYLTKSTWRSDYNGESDGAEVKEYFLYSLDPFGTETGRLSSSSSAFWVGSNGQNAPVEIRSMMKAPEGMVFVSTDAPQSETRTTAYASRNETLRAAVEGKYDFHSLNASAFFGIPYEEIYDDVVKKAKMADVRDLAKPVNHGGSYNMGANTLVKTMGVARLIFARNALGLNRSWNPFQVAVHLFKQFDIRYKGLRTTWYAEQLTKVVSTGRLSCVTGYKPIIVDSPLDNHGAFNAIIALEPQHWSAYIALKMFAGITKLRLEGFPIIPIIQIHDESVAAVPEGQNVDGVLRAVGNLPQHTDWGVLKIPVGKPTYAKYWGEL